MNGGGEDEDGRESEGFLFYDFIMSREREREGKGLPCGFLCK